MSSGSAIVALRNVGKTFDSGTVALDGLTLNVRDGEFVSLLGPSGCGKSTALNCIAGLLPLSGGTIQLDDLRIDTLPPESRGFGMVFQNYALFPHMSVERNIGFGLRMRGVSTAETATRVANALKLVQLTGQEHKLPGQLSGGQQQRVAIARAIVIEPPLVLMDEPLSNLDAKLRIETRAEIRRIHHELGRATIYVTHDQDEALSLADRIVVMKDGVVQQIDRPQQIYAQPANLHVARFMGYRNVIEMEIEGTTGDRVALRDRDVPLTGTPMQALPGKRAMVAMRPEEIVVGEGPEGRNTIVVRVETVEYGGRDSLVGVATATGARLYLRTAHSAAPGDALSIHVPPERALVYAPTPA